MARPISATDTATDKELDSLMGALDAIAVPQDAASPLDDLDSLLDDLGAADPAPPAAPDLPPEAPAAIDVMPPKKRRFAPKRGTLIAAAVLLASHGALFGGGYWLGKASAPHAQGHGGAGEEGGAAPLEGIMRHVGHPADLRVDEHTIFTTPEVHDAVVSLSGGQALADAMEKFAASIQSLGPVTRNGDVLEARACHRERCGAEAYVVSYNSHTHQVRVCQTLPFADGKTASYVFSEEGTEEVPRCVEQTPLPAPSPVAEASAAAGEEAMTPPTEHADTQEHASAAAQAAAEVMAQAH